MYTNILGSTKKLRTRMSDATGVGAYNVGENLDPVGFKSVIAMTDKVFKEHYPYYAKSLKRKRDWGLKALIDVYERLNSKAETKAKKLYDEDEVERNQAFIDKQVDFNKERYRKDTIFNTERSQLIPIQVLNSLKAFELFDIPISSDGTLLNNITSRGFTERGNVRYFDFNKKGELNKLRIPRLRSLISDATGTPYEMVSQFPEYRILRAWISRRNSFNSELQKILKYQNKMNNPERMARLIAGKIRSLPSNTQIDNDVYDAARSFIHPNDMSNLTELGERILIPEEMGRFSKHAERIKPFFKRMLNSGKLPSNLKRTFASYMEKYPSEIREMNIE